MAWTTIHHRSSYECGECKEGSVHLTLTLTTVFCRCQQTVQLPPVPKLIQLKQTISPKTVKNVSKEIIQQLCILCCELFVMLCIVCCVLQYCVVPTIKCQTIFNGNYITMYFVLCIVCCVVYCLLCITVLCCANNQMKFVQQNLIFCHKNITISFV